MDAGMDYLRPLGPIWIREVTLDTETMLRIHELCGNCLLKLARSRRLRTRAVKL